MCAGWGGENSPAAYTGSTLRRTPTFPRSASDCTSPEKALSSLKCAMAAPVDKLYLYFQRQKPLKIRSRKRWSNNSGNRACSHTCKQGRWSLFMSRRICCQDAVMTQTLGWQCWGNTRNDLLNAGAVLTASSSGSKELKRACVSQLLLVIAAQIDEIWSHKPKWRAHSALNEFWEV